MNAHAITLAARQNAFHDLGRVSLPTPAGSDVSEAYTRSASAYVAKLTIPSTSGTGEALQAGGTRKKRDRSHRPWRPGGKGQRIEHREQEREHQEQRRQEREQQEQQQGTRTLSKAGGGCAVDRRERMHNAHDAEPYQEPSAHPATLRALDPGRYSSTASTANHAPSFPSPAGLPSLPPSNPAGLVGYVPERSQQERFGSGSGCQRSTAAKAPGGGSKNGLARLLGRVALALFSFSPRQQFGGLPS